MLCRAVFFPIIPSWPRFSASRTASQLDPCFWFSERWTNRQKVMHVWPTIHTCMHIDNMGSIKIKQLTIDVFWSKSRQTLQDKKQENKRSNETAKASLRLKLKLKFNWNKQNCKTIVTFWRWIMHLLKGCCHVAYRISKTLFILHAISYTMMGTYNTSQNII